MIALLMLLAAQAVPSQLMDEADEASADYTKCLFQSAARASERKLSVRAFERQLRSACSRQEQLHGDLLVRILTIRGEPNPRETVARVHEQSRNQVVEQYEKAPAIEEQLREVEAICRQRPDLCQM